MVRPAACLFALVCAAAPALAQEEAPAGPLAPLAKVGAHLEQGMAAFLGGKEAAEAFAPWKPGKRASTAAEVAAAGAKRARVAGFELELIFFKAKQPTYYLRTFVCLLDGKPAFLACNGRALADGKIFVQGAPLAAYKGAAEPFGKAAEGLLAALLDGSASKTCAVVDPAALGERFALPERERKGLARETQQAREALTKVPAEVQALGHDEVHLRIDDQTTFLYDEAGALLGMLRGGFSLEGEELHYTPGRFRAAPKPETKQPEGAPR